MLQTTRLDELETTTITSLSFEYGHNLMAFFGGDMLSAHAFSSLLDNHIHRLVLLQRAMTTTTARHSWMENTFLP